MGRCATTMSSCRRYGTSRPFSPPCPVTSTSRTTTKTICSRLGMSKALLPVADGALLWLLELALARELQKHACAREVFPLARAACTDAYWPTFRQSGLHMCEGG